MNNKNKNELSILVVPCFYISFLPLSSPNPSKVWHSLTTNTLHRYQIQREKWIQTVLFPDDFLINS